MRTTTVARIHKRFSFRCVVEFCGEGRGAVQQAATTTNKSDEQIVFVPSGFEWWKNY